MYTVASLLESPMKIVLDHILSTHARYFPAVVMLGNGQLRADMLGKVRLHAVFSRTTKNS